MFFIQNDATPVDSLSNHIPQSHGMDGWSDNPCTRVACVSAIHMLNVSAASVTTPLGSDANDGFSGGDAATVGVAVGASVAVGVGVGAAQATVSMTTAMATA